MVSLYSDRGGNIAIVAALIAVPLVVGVATALDLSTINRTKSELQSALDSAALAIAREGKDISDRRADEIASEFLRANFLGTKPSHRVVRSAGSVRVEGSVAAQMAFAGVVGYQDWQITSASTAELAFSSYEVALVLDTTGSMKGGKLASMQDAVVGLVDSMSKGVNDPEKLKFTLVPFASFVNVGPQFAPKINAKGKVVNGTGAAWLDTKGVSDIPQLELKKGVSRFEVYHRLGHSWNGCVETRVPKPKAKASARHDVADTPPKKSDKRSLFVPAFAIDEPDAPGFSNSYIVSDADPLDKSVKGEIKKLNKYGLDGAAIMGTTGGDDEDDDEADDDESSSGATNTGSGSLITPSGMSETIGPNAGCDVQSITPLTSDYNLIRKKVGELQANGTTNIMEGVAWGMRALSPGEPFTEGAAPAGDIEKIMIVLTDGANNFGNAPNSLGSSYSSDGFLVDGRLGIAAGGSSSTTGIMNERTLAACTNAKADGIKVYTIRLEEPDVATGYMLKECASGDDHFFDVPSRGQLDNVFDEIGKRITKVRLSS